MDEQTDEVTVPGEDIEVVRAVRRVLSALDIINADDQRVEWVPTPEWGGSGAGVYVRSGTGLERDEFEQSLMNRDKRTPDVDLRNARAKLVARAACTETGTRIFKDTDVVALGAKNAAPLDRLYDMAAELWGIRQKDMEELLQDFETDPS